VKNAAVRTAAEKRDMRVQYTNITNPSALNATLNDPHPAAIQHSPPFTPGKSPGAGWAAIAPPWALSGPIV
jgi:hypothetical protein